MAPSTSNRLPAEELRQRRKAMMADEESTAARLPATSTRGRKAATASTSTAKQGKRKNLQRSSTPPPSARASGSSSVAPASPSIAIKFAGKVYRTLDTQMDGVTYSSSGDFLGEPDEEVGDIERERADQKRRELQRRMLVEQSSPDAKGKGKRRADFLEDEDAEIDGKRGRKTNAEQLATPVKQQLPSTLHRQRSLSPPAAPPRLAAPFAFRDPSSASSSGPLVPLPAPLADLLDLHSSIEGALIMHLSTSGSSVASTSTDFDQEGKATVRIHNLIEMAELSKMVRCGRRQFGVEELERLVWAWEGCGEMLEEEEDGLRVVRDGEGGGVGEEVGGLGFLVSRKRVGKGNNIQSTYGIGISVNIKANPQLPKFELLPHSPSQKDKAAPPSPSSVGRGREGMNVVALWTQGKDARREELMRRLRAWGRRCAREEQARVSPIYSPSTLPAFPHTLPPIPRAALPTLSPSLPAAIPGSLSPSPKKKVPSHDVFGPAVPIAGAKGSNSVLMLLEGKEKPVKSSVKAAERNRLMRERLLAKKAAATAPSTNHAFLSTLSGTFATSKKSLKPEKTAATDHQTIEKEMYKRNAMVSRLGNVADVVVMLSLKYDGRSIPLHDASSAVSNSPLVKIGEDEAQESLQLLCELFPSFASIKSVERQDWLTLQRDARAVEVKMRVAEELEEVRRRSGAYA
ncbi:hypothetical protein BCR35DRAFT_303129 [Leucosporidium creatinivorum]|uniref:DNA replication factor Cdt1 C-terminal domain-containing protein n=1 Tax=Leucosporidium creatinivorum TaxID=106004 RepID=A0A1Y2FJH4_9BASI|nr:hypothetical protein BCR35DRAFT_303129 [Leucosporidium creatinivorum]